MDDDFRDGALQNVEDICNEGPAVILSKPGTQDEFGENIGTAETLELKSYPVMYSPFNRSTLNKVAWASSVDVIAYVSKKAVATKGHDKESLKRFKKIKVGGRSFDLRYVEPQMNVNDDFIYCSIFG